MKDGKVGIYAIYDKVAACFRQPFYAFEDRFAERAFWMLSEEKDDFGNFLDEYDLKLLGYFDQRTGVIEACEIITITTGTKVRYQKHLKEKELRNEVGNES